MGARHRGHHPAHGPAVAMEQRQGPEIGAVSRHSVMQGVRERADIGAPVVEHHALGIARRARGIVERDRVPLVPDPLALEARIARRQQRVVVELAEPFAARAQGVVDIDHRHLAREARNRGARDPGIFRVREKHLGLAMLEHEAHRARVEPRVDHVEHRAQHGHGVERVERGGDVGREHRHRVAAPHAQSCQLRGEPAAAAVELGVGDAPIAVDDRAMLRIGAHGALEKAQRRQRPAVRGPGIEIALEDRLTHADESRLPRCRSGDRLLRAGAYGLIVPLF